MKIAICTPVYSTVVASYAQSLAQMVHFTDNANIIVNGERQKPEIEIFMMHGSVLPLSRNMLVRNALEWGADYLLWIDSDMSFPKEALLRLLSLSLPVVGANYLGRNPPNRPTAAALDRQNLWTDKAAAEQEKVEEVLSLGLGFCLVDISVIKTLASERVDGKPVPFFALELQNHGADYRGEDFYFFKRVRAAGIPVHLDHHLSWFVSHWSFRALNLSEC